MANSARSRSADPVARVHAAVAHALAMVRASGTQGALPAVCVGLSGGVDSMVLLQAFASLEGKGGLHLSAVHVHHGLSPNADGWATTCRSACRRLKVPLSVVRVVVDRQSGLGIEAAARLQRQRVFAAQRADWIALGHHRDDQAETVLLQLLRGAGLRGLSGMPDGSEIVEAVAEGLGEGTGEALGRATVGVGCREAGALREKAKEGVVGGVTDGRGVGVGQRCCAG